jgi:hypothetical protein
MHFCRQPPFLHADVQLASVVSHALAHVICWFRQEVGAGVEHVPAAASPGGAEETSGAPDESGGLGAEASGTPSNVAKS